MKKRILSFLIFTTLTTLGFAAEGDTSRIESHQQTHWDWAGSWYDTVQFPQTGEYRKILMYYTLGCPSQGCSEWDYTTKIQVSDQVNDSTKRWVELTRIMTPYAGDKNADWTHTWTFDVTDFAPLLNGEREIRADYSGYQDGFTITINFDFIEGTAPREVLEVNTLYDGTFKYGFTNDPIENHLVPTDIAINANTETAKFRMVASGHSFGGNQNCAEFCPKWYKLKIDGSAVVQEDVWRDDCGSNVLEGQTGTWPYNRSGWCPGDITTPYETNISNFVDAGQSNSFDVDWESYTYTGGAGFDPQYIIEALVFQYGPWAHNLDISIDKIITPSLDDRAMELNPICGNPQIEVSNLGATNVTSMKIEYWTEGTTGKHIYEWNGNLRSGESTILTMASTGKWFFSERTDNVFYAEVVEVNGTTDEYESNNLNKARFETASLYPNEIIINFKNNAATNQTGYTVVSEDGTVVFERNQSAPNATYYDTVALDPGCYTLMITDQGCDGLNFFANSDGSGRIWVHDADPANYFPPLMMFDNEFGCDKQLSFTVGYTLGEDELEGNTDLNIYPNPSNGTVNISVEDFNQNGLVEIYTVTGQKVAQYNLEQLNGIEVSGLAGGNYIAKFSSENSSLTKQFVIVK